MIGENLKKTVLAIVGLPGSGKNVLTDYLMQKTSWPKVYFGRTVIDEVVRRGLPITEASERTVRENLREQYGMAALAILNLPKIQELFVNSSVILESFYSWEEYLFMKERFGDAFKVLAVSASPKVRSDRLKHRPYRPLTEVEFTSRDYSQIENLHQAGPIARADFVVVNEGNIEELYMQVDKILQKLL